MAYSLLSLGPPKKKSELAEAAGVSPVYTPPSYTTAATAGGAPQAAIVPDYGTQLSQTQSQNVSPVFDAGTPNAAATTPFAFSNAGQGNAFGAAPKAQGGKAEYDGQSVDYGSDPILKQVESAVQSQIAEAQAAALGQEKTNLIRYGSSDLVRQVLGDKADDQTAQAAQDNPFSTVAELARWNDRGLGNVDSTANRANLFFSSTRARDRGLQEEDYTRKRATTANQLQDVLSSIAQGLLQTRQGAQGQLLGAQENAYGRAMNKAMSLAQMAAAAKAAAAHGGGDDGGGDGGGDGTPDGGGTISDAERLGAPLSGGTGISSTDTSYPTNATSSGVQGWGYTGPSRYYTLKTQAQNAARAGQRVYFTKGKGYYVA